MSTKLERTMQASDRSYSEFEGSSTWQVVSEALAALEKNKDLQLQTERRLVVGYICKQLAANQLVAKSGVAQQGAPADPLASASLRQAVG
ncbi:hypothetical protein [Panacagrimonas perspica]|uniref:hypothetical protein n=1 Tax=Panacagrimonas perspica TaxID=381431 RepID=UPI00105CC16E|nr:hypothetical protein [Panacagrimonas perspica]